MRRRYARELALQVLYQMDVGKSSSEKAMEYISEQCDEQNVIDFSASLVQGTVENMSKIDNIISAHLTSWKLNSIAAVDRNLMRLATYELYYCEDIPSSVSINEALELAKIFSGEKSSKFINGILDAIKKDFEVEN
ncbi:N utilization substance protein B [Desulfitispora alkaliphila]|uniref:transcription antitermination factor NusB n=1 Tax=Desulfitispora alkaliphila TaxID=622674 RepID=UPI003D1DC255